MVNDAGEAPVVLADEDRRLVAGLADKYARMQALRAELARGVPSAEDQARLRALALDFPGALRELETVGTDELRRRAELAAGAAEREHVPAWLLWTAHYHALMRNALAARRGGRGAGVEPLPEGRLNVVVFAALAARFGTAQATIWERLFPQRGSRARAYRG